MKKIAFALLLGGLIAPALPTGATAGTAIAGACMGSEKGRGAQALCGCIQSVADAVLSPADQKRGAKIILEPHMSQEIRASARQADNDFWAKWSLFGETAAEYCQ